MPYATKTYSDILQEILTDYANQIPGADVSAGSDIYVKATALASAVWGLYQNQQWLARQIFPDSADATELERHAALRGLSRKPASKASGTVTFTGTNGTVVNSVLSLKTAEGVYFTTTSGGTIASGTLSVSAQAADGGASGNIPAATSLTVQDPPAGLDSAAVTAAAFTGGADSETDTALLTRLLDVLRQPPAGGTANDYKTWALEVTSVEAAYVYPLRGGLGSVTVIPLVAGSGASRIPSQGLIDEVKAHIDLLRPVTVKTLQVIAPTEKSQAVTAAIKPAAGYTFTQVQPWVEAALTAYMDTLEPLEVLYKSKLERVISDVEGIDDRSVTVPSANVTPVDSGATAEMVTAGTITITAMT